MRPLALALLLVALTAAPVQAQPAVPCVPLQGSWAFTTTTVTFYRCAADALSWVAVAVVGGEAGSSAWGDLTGTLSAQTDLQAALDGKLGATGNGSGLIGLTKTQVGLASVDNTSDASKPISTATQTALNAKQATLVSGTTIKTINGSTVLGSGDLTVSGSAAWGSVTGTLATQTDLQTALDAKAAKASNLSDLASAATAFGNIKQAASTTATGVVELATDGENAANVVVQGNDARLSNARTPTAHAHAPADITGTAVVTADSRLTDARTPTAHATSHVTGGSDVIAVAVAGGAAGLLTGADKTKLDAQSGTNTGNQTITLTGAVTGSGTGSFATTYAGVVPFAQGGRAGSAATSATTGTMTVNMTTAIVSITPTGACTFNATGGIVGQIVTFIITTAGVTSFTLTWGTNFRKTGTLATGTVSARFFAVTFVNVDGTIWQEIARTVVQT